MASVLLVNVPNASPAVAQAFFPEPPSCPDQAARSGTARRALDKNLATAEQLMNEGRPGFFKFASDLGDLACQTGDRTELDALFLRCIRECVDERDRYFALVEYGAALERFRDNAAAESAYQQAIELRTLLAEGIAAYNRYAVFLYRLGRKREALDLLSRFSADALRTQRSVATLKELLLNELQVPEARDPAPVRGSTGMLVGSPP